MEINKIFEGVYRYDKKILTVNLTPGEKVYGEKLIKIGDTEYRVWDPYRSKLCAALLKGLKEFPIKRDSKILYLGAASGTTASHISDIATAGTIYCVEFAPEAMRRLVEVCEKRKNMIPIFEDARKPESYSFIKEVDAIYEDVAQRDQVRILFLNSKYLKPNGHAMIAVKSQCIDSAKSPKEVYESVKKELSEKFEIIQSIELEPFEKDHIFIIARKKS
jgi:fibrillarin-like pre-rRNA processing protein